MVMFRLAPFALTLLVCACTPNASERPLTIFAASSLTEAFNELTADFANRSARAKPSVSFAGSQVLRLQLAEGAAADVFASADASHIEALVASGRMHDAHVFAENELVVIVPRSNPASIKRFADLPRASRIVVGSPEVPIGIYTRELLRRSETVLGPEFAAEVRSRIVSEESNVRLVRAKVELGEADAAIVYRTDVSPGVRAIEVPRELMVRARYHVGFVGAPPHSTEAKEFVAFLASAEGRAVLSKHGFSTP